ncbi:MAG: hypothetical protein V1776_02405 [Candidatus Diapherotrites archaeon]
MAKHLLSGKGKTKFSFEQGPTQKMIDWQKSVANVIRAIGNSQLTEDDKKELIAHIKRYSDAKIKLAGRYPGPKGNVFREMERIMKGKAGRRYGSPKRGCGAAYFQDMHENVIDKLWERRNRAVDLMEARKTAARNGAILRITPRRRRGK